MTPDLNQENTNSKGYALCLSILLSLFIFRSVFQLIQYLWPLTWLPNFEYWQSGVLPYPLLLASQVVITIVGLWLVFGVARGKFRTISNWGNWILIVGFGYLGLMMFRILAGLTIASGSPWFDTLIPSISHMVLAGFLIVLGAYMNLSCRNIVAMAFYPMLVSTSLVMHLILLEYGVGIEFATLTPVLGGALAIVLMEKALPYELTWKPGKKEVFNDLVFMLLIQNLLPKFLGFIVAVSLLNFSGSRISALFDVWPHQWPLFLQLLLMMLTAEFMRYWLHRLAHNWKLLWRFHAVHHSPHKLYSINVGRFHPLEKCLQYLFDVLPFLVFGVSENVLGLYFVFYAVNGFSQHCNVDMKLGFLNYIVSGPELHRWHHSRDITESNNNFGNNLIVWDLIFGTWFLPANRKVGVLGLINRDYPVAFLQQMSAPFFKGLDKKQRSIAT